MSKHWKQKKQERKEARARQEEERIRKEMRKQKKKENEGIIRDLELELTPSSRWNAVLLLIRSILDTASLVPIIYFNSMCQCIVLSFRNDNLHMHLHFYENGKVETSGWSEHHYYDDYEILWTAVYEQIEDYKRKGL